MEAIVQAIQSATCVGDVLDILARASRRFGADRFSYHFTPVFESQTGGKTIITEQGFAPGWISLYDNAHFRQADPIPDYVMREGKVLTWRQALAQQHLEAPAIDFAHALDAYGLVHGCGVPAFGPDNRNAYVAFGFNHGLTSDDDGAMAALAAIAQTAHLRICELTPRDVPVGLSAREREVLGWVGRGKSNRDIADILEVSPETVKTYMQRIYAKLDVGDRVGATVKALKLSIITL